MARSHNIVFLIDIDSIPQGDQRGPNGVGSSLRRPRLVEREPLEEGEMLPSGAGAQAVKPDHVKPAEKEFIDSSHSPRRELRPVNPPPFGDVDRPPKHHSVDLEWLRYRILLFLYKEASPENEGEYDYGRVQWSFKFFDSTRYVDYQDGRTFLPFDEKSFCKFENLLDERMDRSLNNVESWESGERPHAIKYLSDAIKMITACLPWPEVDASGSSSDTEGDAQKPKNTVVVFMKVPRSEDQLEMFSGLERSSSKDFMEALLPPAYSNQFHRKLGIQLNFFDMWSACNNKDFADPAFNYVYPRQISGCLSYLGGGKVMLLSLLNLQSGHSFSTEFGLLPYELHLRSRLRNNGVQNENLPSHIQRLVPGALLSKTGQKIPPEFRTGSVNRSLWGPAGRELESSINSQNQYRGVRQLRQPSRYGDDDDHLEFHKTKLANIKEQDRLREGDRDRKRKRLEYEHEDTYNKSYLHRSTDHMDDEIETGYYDSVDMDSKCEKDQRMNNWLNEGGFASSKRKKPMDATTRTVPMARPALNKSAHVFPEPAPKKFPGCWRGTKMLATVERKMTAVQTKRRIREGIQAMNFERIAQQQEKELSAIKRRLKNYLEGELGDDDNPLAWHDIYKKRLRAFADMTLESPNPCLVALAQALVNDATVKYTLDRVNNMRDAYQNKRLTAKDLLGEILLTDFTALNRKIINASETRDKTPGLETGGTRTVIAFLEAELQIILRLEIAWCFVEPDEDATEDLLDDITRLLQIIAVYRTQPPIHDFINSVLLPTYRQSSLFMKELYKKMNIALPAQLAIDGSPLASARHEDDASMISSTSSANLHPEDSASQLQLHKPKRLRHSPAETRMRSFGQYNTGSRRKEVRNSGSKKVKRQILVASSNPKFAVASTSQDLMERPNSHKRITGGVSPKASPKRVRRNLFDVQKHDKKDSKILLTLCSSSRLTKSPAFKSPKGKSPLSGSGSGFFRAARSRRQLVMSEPSNQRFGSPTINSDVLCPESPATPGERRSICSKYAPTVTPRGSESPCCIQESPELIKNDHNENRPMTKVSSLSFYSTGNKSSKSRAWERSETQLLAARIKDSMDLRTRDNHQLSPCDLEIFPQSPDVLSKPPLDVTASMDTPEAICYDSTDETGVGDEIISAPLNAESSGSQLSTGPAPDLDNPRIEAVPKVGGLGGQVGGLGGGSLDPVGDGVARKPFDFLFAVEEDGGGVGLRRGTLWLSGSLAQHTEGRVVGSTNFLLEPGQMALIPGSVKLLTISRAGVGVGRPRTGVATVVEVMEESTIDPRMPAPVLPPRKEGEGVIKVIPFSIGDIAVLESGKEPAPGTMRIETVEDVGRMLKQGRGQQRSSVEPVGREVAKLSGNLNINNGKRNGKESPDIIFDEIYPRQTPPGRKKAMVHVQKVGSTTTTGSYRQPKRAKELLPLPSEARRYLKVIFPAGGTTTPPAPPVLVPASASDSGTTKRVFFQPQTVAPGSAQNSPGEPFGIGSFNPQTGKYSCDLCPTQKWTNINHVRGHYAKVHLQILYSCELCQRKSFKHITSFLRHFETDHAGIRHVCGSCNTSYTKKRSLRLHMDRTGCTGTKDSKSNNGTSSVSTSYFKVLDVGTLGRPQANASSSANLGKGSWNMRMMAPSRDQPPSKKIKIAPSTAPRPGEGTKPSTRSTSFKKSI